MLLPRTTSTVLYPILLGLTFLLGSALSAQVTLYFEDFENDTGATLLADDGNWTAEVDNASLLASVADHDVSGDLEFEFINSHNGSGNPTYEGVWNSLWIDVSMASSLSVTYSWSWSNGNITTAFDVEAIPAGSATLDNQSGTITTNGTTSIRLVATYSGKSGTWMLLDDVMLSGIVSCSDSDADGICDDVDPCVGALDACNVCNGPGAIYECGCNDIPSGDCDCNGNQLDALGVCGGGCSADVNGNGVCDDQELLGCTDSAACNYDPAATEDDGSCAVDDACGVCGGPGAIYDCGCSGIPAGDCDCNGNQLDALGVCGGPCLADADADGICDDVDDCVGDYDACGVCNGEGVTWSMVTDPLEGGTYQVFTFEASSIGALSTVDLTLTATGGVAENNWASDLLIAIVAPGGSGVEWGGYNGISYGQGFIVAEDWPITWDSGAEEGSPWSITVDISAAGLSGSGEWTVLLGNGYSATTAGMTYAVDLSPANVCSESGSCTDDLACNYDAGAAVDDGSCSYSLAGDCSCVTEVLASETLAGGEAGAVVTFDGAGTLGYLEIDINYTGAGESWPADLLVVVTSPTGDCMELGGYSPAITSGCMDMETSVLWPSAWASSASGVYSGTVNLGASGLYGDGTWSVQLWNGYAESTAVTYDVMLRFRDICADGPIIGCMNPAACNYILSATVDNGGCLMTDDCGVCGGDNSSCGGCTDPLACNFDVTATVDDGSCDPVDDPVVGCCSYTVENSQALAGNQSYSWPVQASGIGGLGLFEISIDFAATGSMRNWASDLVVIFEDPAGNCLWFGGNEYTELPSNWYGCEQLPGVWPEGWDSNVEGTYTAEVDLTGSALSGIGMWNVTIQNGDLQTSPADYTFLTWTVDGLCYVEGCTEIAACNYTPNATVAVNDSCIYAENCEVCNPDGSVTLYDADGDGICDDDEVLGCTSFGACNYNVLATEEDGTCDYCSCPGDNFTSNLAGYGIEIDTVATDIGWVSDGLGNTIDLSGYNTYRLYVTMANADDFMNAVSGDANNPTHLSTTTSFYQHGLRNVTPAGINPLLLAAHPSLQYDSWVTIGIDGPPGAGEENVTTIESPGQPWIQTFDPGDGLPGASIVMNDVVGGIWFALTGNANGVAGDDLRVLIAQLTTDGDLSGDLYCQILEDGDGANGTLSPTFSFVPPNACGCTDAAACNYDADADHDDGACYYPDECGVCDGPGAIYECGCMDIPEGDCDCNGNVLDECGVCGGTGIPEGACDCNGNVLDECGVCGGAGIAEGECDCNGNVLDACGVCGGAGVDVDDDGICDDIDNCTDTTSMSFADEGNIACLYYGCVNPTADNYNPDPSVVGCEMGVDQCCIWYGCTDGSWTDGSPPACNYDHLANDDDGSCEYVSCEGCMDGAACNYDPDALINTGCDYSCLGCTNPCSENFDPDATVDDGSCTAVPGCMDTTACNYDCSATINYAPWCDYLDECMECGGPGAIYDCGCSDIPEGDCDCDGNQLDALGVCGGDCLSDADGDGVCDWPAGCMDPTACNYDAAVIVSDGSCVYAEAPCFICSGETDGTGTVIEDPTVVPLPDVADLESGAMEANPGGYILVEDASSAYSTVDDPCGRLDYTFGSEDCPDLADVSVLPQGVHELYVTVSNGVESLIVPTTITVVVDADPETCGDRAACNFGVSFPCFYPGQQGNCQDPSGNTAWVYEISPEGDECICVAKTGTQLWFESFDAGGAADLSLNSPVALGDGYSGATDDNSSALNPEWELDLGSGLGDGLLEGDGSEPEYWNVQGPAGDLHFEGGDLNGWELGWVSRELDVSAYGVVTAEAYAQGINVASGDYLDLELTGKTMGDSLSGVRYEGFIPGFISTPLLSNVDTVRLDVRAMSDGEGKQWIFDDVRLWGWIQGCTDSRAENYNSEAAFDDGSCTYSWESLSAITSGAHNERIWLATSLVSPGIQVVEATMADLNDSSVVRVRPDVSLVVNGAELNNGCLRVKSLEIEPGGSVVVPEGVALEVVEPLNAAMGNRIKGPGKLHLLGGLDWSTVEEQDLPVATLENVKLDVGAAIEVPQGRQLAIHGNLEFPTEAAVTMRGRVSMIGPGTRTISGHPGNVDHLSVELCTENDIVTVEMDTLSVLNRLTLIKGEMNTAGNLLRFASDSGGTGLLDAIPAEASLRGSLLQEAVSARVERFIGPDDDGTTYVSNTYFAASGIKGATVADLNGIDGFYSAGWPSADYPDASSTVLFWDETTGSLVTPTHDGTPLDTLGGCWIWLLGSQNPVMRVEGALRSHAVDGAVSYRITRSEYEEGVFTGWNVTSAVHSGWNLVPNPYQSRIDWNVVHSQNAELIQDQYLVYDTQDKEFKRYSATGLDSMQVNGRRYIEPGTTFYVCLREGLVSDSLTIPTAAIDNAALGGAFIRSTQNNVVLLQLENAWGTSYLRLVLGEDGTHEYVHGPDISFISSNAIKKAEIAVLAAGGLYASKQIARETEVPLFLKSRAGLETVMRVIKAPEGLCGFVSDAETGQSLPLVVGEEMGVLFAENVPDEGRFMLSLHDFARAEARMPSCPEAVDGKVAVHVGEGVTANMSLLSPEGVVLDQLLGVEEEAEFVSVAPGDYTVVVTGVEGTTCPKSQREVSVPPGEQPELLGLDWSETPCNEEPVNVQFELYGGGTFGWTLIDDEGVVQQGAGAGEIEIAGLEPGAYVLDVDHACLQEFVEFDAVDPNAPVMACEWNEVVVADNAGEAWLTASFTGTADAYRWIYEGIQVSENEMLELPVSGEGVYEVILEADRGGCSAAMTLTYTVASDLRGVLASGFTVFHEASQWIVQADEEWEQLNWVLYDAAGRTVHAGNAGEGQIFMVPHPNSAGVYSLEITRQGGLRDVLSLISGSSN